jgi:hypothetical protein
MDHGYAGREAPLESHQMWRLLLARAHPDAGGDHELFLFACALRDSHLAERRFADASSPGGTAADDDASPAASWRNSMTSWASRNRDALRRPRSWRTGTRAR